LRKRALENVGCQQGRAGDMLNSTYIVVVYPDFCQLFANMARASDLMAKIVAHNKKYEARKGSDKKR